ncbi:DUF3307 domain-containing protein [Flavobacterium sp. ALJ2]|uniref:DUF3307 domain-containing protein n=1 Tax=Flavobacterium sp. ALJ2 TaxID=2786960 RepID=UPI00189F7629|nr:DUF3307 domain-containing protein [Flavobacterium sp. ALJ2]MBF7090120.1 DUF3307 domain-containing protein [Flavobacterium sp. ALJ2]
MILFVKLFLAHILGDFIFQPNSWVADKEIKKQKSIFLYIHAALHGILTWILIGELSFGWYALLLAVTHGFIDFLKLHFQKTSTKITWFIGDQIAHFIVLIAIAFLYNHQKIDLLWFNSQFWIVVTGFLFLTKPTSICIKNLISVWTPENNNRTDNSLANAGNYIGTLERLFVFCFIITGHFEAIGFLLAAKSIFRFGDLKEAKDRKLTEYVLIGTLLSFGVALLTGLIVQVMLLQTF